MLLLFSLFIQYVLLLFFFKLSKSLLSKRIVKPIGVTTTKKIIPNITGDTKLPKIIPNNNQILFNGVNMLELNNPNKKKIKDMHKNAILISPPCIKGYNEISKNIILNIIPKFLLVGNFKFSVILFIYKNLHMVAGEGFEPPT